MEKHSFVSFITGGCHPKTPHLILPNNRLTAVRLRLVSACTNAWSSLSAAHTVVKAQWTLTWYYFNLVWVPPAGQANGKYCCPKIYFNHRCFSGPYLNKGRIAELPQCVGPGNCVLVLKEVSYNSLLTCSVMSECY